MKVWIDLANSPHPVLFAPVARQLRADGHEVLVTARDNAQTVELARERWSDVRAIGGESPKPKVAKVDALVRRIAALRAWALSARPDVALSHNSYAQIVAARALRIPAVTAMDFEWQPANHLAFRLATTVVLPEAFPDRAARRQGAAIRKVVRYRGLKEELYAGDFEPDAAILERLGIEGRNRAIVVLRTPPERAVYHSFASPLFEAALRILSTRADVVCVALTRHREQAAAIERMGLANFVVPRHAVDARSLMYAADAVVGGGGTMTREAAVMGIPTWSLFAGRPPAVDLWLERQGLLTRVTNAEQLRSIGPRVAQPRPLSALRDRGHDIERLLVDVTESVFGHRRGTRHGAPTMSFAEMP